MKIQLYSKAVPIHTLLPGVPFIFKKDDPELLGNEAIWYVLDNYQLMAHLDITIDATKLIVANLTNGAITTPAKSTKVLPINAVLDVKLRSLT